MLKRTIRDLRNRAVEVERRRATPRSLTRPALAGRVRPLLRLLAPEAGR
jgi:hypothetical protein